MPQDIYSKAGADAATSAAINALGLGTAATKDVGTTAGTVMAADDERVASLPSTYAPKSPILYRTLTAATTALTIPPTAPTDEVLAFALTQDVTGGRSATYGGSSLPIKLVPRAETMVVFSPIGGVWWAKVVEGVGSAGATGAYDDAVAAIGSVQGYYPMDDALAATTARNLGTSGTALTKSNTAVFEAVGIGDGATAAYTGTGNGYFATTADKPLSAAGPGTFAALIKLGTPASSRGLYNAGMKVSLSSAGIITLLCNGVTTTSVTALVAGVRYHIACVVDGTAHRIYINGVQNAATTTAVVMPANSQNNSVCLDGSNFANAVNIAGVIVTPHALTQPQLAALTAAAGL